jgi:hypothetical protein
MTSGREAPASGPPRLPARRYVIAAAGVLIVMVATLYAMGRLPICRCGYVKPWHGVVFSSENSQHLSDWYSFTHVIHGFVFYALLWLGRGWWPLGLRVVLATLLEASWEVLENTDFVINRYREVTISLDYFGDSIINSTADVIAMLAGFLVAARLPWRATLALALALEVFLAVAIRDNLTLNVIMLIHPLDAVRHWQGQ